MTGPPLPPRRVTVEVTLLRNLERYLGDQPQRDKRAQDLHAQVVTVLTAQGLL